MNKTLIGLALMAPFVAAQAALPAGIDTAFATLQTDATTLLDNAMPVILFLAGAFWAIKTVRRLIRAG